MTDNFDNLDQMLIQEFETFLKDANDKKYIGDKVWTNQLKRRIGTLGRKLGYKVAVGGFREDEEFEREWLYDIVWYVEDGERRLTKIPLIVESEWDRNYSGIKFDFEKLLVGNAERRLMICQCRTNEIDNLFDKLKRAIDTFEENHGDRFLIAVLDSQTESNFYYKTYTKS